MGPLALVRRAAGFYNKSMIHHTLRYFFMGIFCCVSLGPAYAQAWKIPAKKAVQRAAKPAAENISQKTRLTAARGLADPNQITAARNRAQHLWKTLDIHAAQDRKALAAWAMEQSLRLTSPFYQAAEWDIAFIRARAPQGAEQIQRDFIHVNNVDYASLTQGKNRIFTAADWNDGSRLQITRLIKTLRQTNSAKKLIVASPYFPFSRQPYPSGSYSRFHHENGADPFVKKLLHEPNVLLVPLARMPGASVQNHLRAWIKSLHTHYSPAAFGKTDAVLVVIAPSQFIEGNAGSLRRTAWERSPWNKDESVTLSIRTRAEQNLTDFKWNLICAHGKKQIPPPYINDWRLNAFVDRTGPEFSNALGTDFFIRVHPAPAVR